MDEAAQRALQSVADRIVKFVRGARKLARVGEELSRDRVVGIVAIDQCRERRRHRDRIPAGDSLKLLPPFGCGKTRFDQRLGAHQCFGKVFCHRFRVLARR